MSELLEREQQNEDQDEDEDLLVENLLDAMDEIEPNQPEPEQDDIELMEDLLDVMDETDEKKAAEEQKNREVQRKYFQGLHDIFTNLDLTKVDENDDNHIELDELKNYIKANQLSVPMYLAENIFYSIDTDRNGFISPIEYLKWKTRVTVDQIGVLTEVIVPKQPEEELKSDFDIELDANDMDEISIDGLLDDDDLFDVVKIMDEAEEKQEMDDMLKEMEAAAEEKRIMLKQKKKEMELEELERKKYAEEQRRKKEEEEDALRKQEQEIKKQRRALEDEKNLMERQKKIEKIKQLEAYIKHDGKSGPATQAVAHEDDEDYESSDDFDESTDSDWTTDDYSDDDGDGRKTTMVEADNTCTKFFPCFRVLPCCNKPQMLRPTTAARAGDNGEKDIIKVIAAAKRRLSKFIYKYGDDYVDDDTMVLSQERLQRLAKDVNMEGRMGIYFWSLVLDKQSQKAYDCLWPVLRYLGAELPTPVAVELMKLYRVELSRYPPAKIEGITRVIVQSSKFSIATALEFAAFFNERAHSDLANTRLLRKYSENYQNIAAEELRQIESDYLASMTMMTKSFHSYKTPFDIAVQNELIEFLSSDRMGRIGHAIWVKRDLLRPEISENSFEVRSTGIIAIVKQLPNPREFYFTPIGFQFTETFLFFLYLGIFTAITITKPTVYEELHWYDWVLFVCNFGYIFNEILQFIQEGPGKYFQTWENAIDIVVSILWIVIMFLRILAVLLVGFVPELSSINVLSGIQTEDSFLNLLFTALWVINIILLWIRCLHFLMLSNQEGPLINVMINMASDVKNWLWVFAVITVGFVFGTYFLVGDTNIYVQSEQRALTLTILAAFGQPNWYHVQSGDEHILNVINSWMIIIYSILGFVLLINLLIAMMAESYSQTEGQSAKEVLLNTASLAFELDTSPKIMPPPLNSILFVFFLIYNVVDILVLAFTAEFLNEQGWSKYWRCRNKDCKFLNQKAVIDEHIKQGWDGDFPCGLCDQLHTMDDIFKSSKRRFRRKARGLEGSAKNNFCNRLGHGFKELFVSKTKWKRHSWSCGYCRSRIPANYSADLKRYFKRLQETHNLDQNDVNWILSMNPQLCPFCYRPRRPRARPVYILENISFLIFLIFVYPVQWLLLWPIYLYDSVKNPDKAQKDYKEFRDKHNKLYSLRPDANTVRKQMPRSWLHQTLISLHHPIWRSLHKHRSTVKGQSLAQSIHSANLRQERVRGVNEQEKRGKVAKISHLVMNVVSSMSNVRIKWEPTGTELLERMSVISGVDIDSDWYTQHKTSRAEKMKKDKLMLMFEAAGGKNMSAKTAQKINALSQRRLGTKNFSIDFEEELDLDIGENGGGVKRTSLKFKNK